MKHHHQERIWIALGCAVGFAVVLLVERMNRAATRTAVVGPVVADLQPATGTGPAGDVVWTNAPWQWSARPTKWWTLQQVRGDRSVSIAEAVPVHRPRPFDLIDFRHQPSVTVEMGR